MRNVLRLTSALMLSFPLLASAQPADLLPPLEPDLAPPAERDVTPPLPQGNTEAITAATTDGSPSFRFNGIRLKGNTALSREELAPIWQYLFGTDVTLATLDDITSRIGARYRANGNVLSQAILPEQTVEDGIVEVLVVEGFVDQVEISGGADNQQQLAHTYFSTLPTERPLRLETLERSVLLSRDSFGGLVETVLEPSPETFGAANLGVLITQEPTSWFTTLDNRGSRLYGAWTLGGGSRSYNLLGLNGRIDTLVAIAPDDTSLAYGAVVLDIPLAGLSGTFFDGGRIEFSGDASRGDPDLAKSGSPEELTVTLDESNLRFGMIVPFIRTRSQNLFGRIGLGYRYSNSATDFDLDNDGEIDSTTEIDRLVVLDARATWDIADSIGGVTLIDAEFRQGLDIGSVQTSGQGPAAGVPDFTLAALNVSRLQRIGTGSWSLWGEALGQYAANVLPNSERFALGNGTIGRGFAPGNTTGDSGFGVRLEVRKLIGAESMGGNAEAAELYLFGDYGRARDRSQDRDAEKWETLSSVGIGARLDIRDWLTLTPEIAHQIDGTPSDSTDGGHETRFFIGAIARF
jgi:hemolysin activation/secretion protein